MKNLNKSFDIKIGSKLWFEVQTFFVGPGNLNIEKFFEDIQDIRGIISYKTKKYESRI